MPERGENVILATKQDLAQMEKRLTLLITDAMTASNNAILKSLTLQLRTAANSLELAVQIYPPLDQPQSEPAPAEGPSLAPLPSTDPGEN